MMTLSNFEDWFYKFNAWSFSRHQLLNFCNRAYYYRYIAGALKYSPVLNVPKIKRLKSLKSKFVLQGTLIHDAIEDQITQHYLGRNVNQESAQEQYLKRLNGFQVTADDMITEYFNGEQKDTTFFDDIRVSGIEMLDTFFRIVWPNLKPLEYLKHEKFDKFYISKIPVTVKLDYITKNNDGKLVLSDWKTGRERKESNLQIGIYVLFAMEQYDMLSEDIFSEVIYLGSSGRPRPHKFSTDQLDEIKGIITNDFERMNVSYDIEDFPADPFPKKCICCQFATICPESKHKDQDVILNDTPIDPFTDMLIDIE
jgi:CRISPR/Cas system-associated exonuclease Cas4 (RecB family)